MPWKINWPFFNKGALNSNLRKLAPEVRPVLFLFEYCCLTLALLAAVASIAELERPAGLCRGDPLDKDAEIHTKLTHKIE